MILLGVTKQAALEKDSSAYCLRKEEQLPCVCGDSKAWPMDNIKAKNENR
jgi:hypothetical protein